MKDKTYTDGIDAIHRNQDMSINEKRVAAGKLSRETASRLFKEGKTVAEISELMGLPKSSVHNRLESQARKEQITKGIQDQNLSVTSEFKIDGPWAHKGLRQLTAPLFHFLPGGVKEEIGEVVATTDDGLQFEIKLNEGFEDIEVASFEVPMRFHVRKK